VERHARGPAAPSHLPGQLSRPALGVQPALAGDRGIRIVEPAVEPEQPQHDRRAGDQMRAEGRPEPAGEPSRGAAHDAPARIARKRRRQRHEAVGQPLHLLRRGALLWSEDLGRALERDGRVAEHFEARIAGTAGSLECVDRPAAAVGRAAPARCDEHTGDAGTDRRRDQLARPGAAGRLRITLGGRHQVESRRRRGFHDRGLAVPEEGIPALDRPAQGVMRRRGAPFAAERRDEDLGRPVAAIGGGAEVGARPGPLEPATDRRGNLSGTERSLEGVGCDQVGGHT